MKPQPLYSNTLQDYAAQITRDYKTKKIARLQEGCADLVNKGQACMDHDRNDSSRHVIWSKTKAVAISTDLTKTCKYRNGIHLYGVLKEKKKARQNPMVRMTWTKHQLPYCYVSISIISRRNDRFRPPRLTHWAGQVETVTLDRPLIGAT